MRTSEHLITRVSLWEVSITINNPQSCKIACFPKLFTPTYKHFLHGYIHHICDISQLTHHIYHHIDEDMMFTQLDVHNVNIVNLTAVSLPTPKMWFWPEENRWWWPWWWCCWYWWHSQLMLIMMISRITMLLMIYHTMYFVCESCLRAKWFLRLKVHCWSKACNLHLISL